MLTRFKQDNIDLRTRFKTYFEDAQPDVRVIWEGQPEDRGGDPFPALDEQFVKIMLRQNDTQQVSIGGRGPLPLGRRFRSIGTVAVFVQTEANKGLSENERIADLVGRSLAAVTLGNVLLRNPTYRMVGTGNGQWFRSSVTVPYESTFDENDNP